MTRQQAPSRPEPAATAAAPSTLVPADPSEAHAGQANVLAFLRHLGGRPELLRELKTRPKDEVIAVAADHGYPFAATDFDAVVWDAEARLADRRGEPFDGHFSLWSTLWGRHYLEMLVEDLVPALTGGRSR